MSECGVCIGSEADGICDFYSVKTVKARKEHRCEECGKTILPGERYEYHFSKYDGDTLEIKTCLVCVEIRDAFREEGSAICVGYLWDEMEQDAFPVLTTACFDRLSTPEAKTELQRRWIEWKGLPH